MKVFLAGAYTREKAFIGKNIDYMLESFFYVLPWQIERIPNMKMFLLDSGAFTFMNSQKGKINFDEYLTRYINFINKYDIKYFFELDVDSIVGYEKVKQLRKRLENETGKKCIPVWHKSRGKEEYLKMCEEYDYVAIGGIVTKEITKEQYSFLPWFINEAHKRGCKIHGLGFTDTNLLQKYHFDSVDSTAWLSGSRFGHVYYFDNGVMKNKTPPRGKKTVHYKLIDEQNVNEWLKFQRYAENNL